jgi:hypothetical protein
LKKYNDRRYVSFMTHVSPPEDVCDLLKNDAMGTFFLSE